LFTTFLATASGGLLQSSVLVTMTMTGTLAMVTELDGE